MENEEKDVSGNKEAKKIRQVNLLVLVVIVVFSFTGQGAFLSFIVGLIAGLSNFILMFVYISQGKTSAYLTCIISMLLLPIIGFGCCAMGISSINI